MGKTGVSGFWDILAITVLFPQHCDPKNGGDGDPLDVLIIG